MTLRAAGLAGMEEMIKEVIWLVLAGSGWFWLVLCSTE
jgi:hypothetical protein